ncbi:unnamed protein product, partial [marine sediment metagenome]
LCLGTMKISDLNHTQLYNLTIGDHKRRNLYSIPYYTTIVDLDTSHLCSSL